MGYIPPQYEQSIQSALMRMTENYREEIKQLHAAIDELAKENLELKHRLEVYRDMLVTNNASWLAKKL